MMKALYTASATATGGRDGQVTSDNGVLDVQVSVPKAMGGVHDDNTNPEQLFAAGYAACFDSAIQYVVKKELLKVGPTQVTAKVTLGALADGRFGLAVQLDVNIPGIAIEQAQLLSEQAHQVCPYSNATRGNIEVEINTTNK